MKQLMAGAGVTLLLTTGAFLFWQGHAENRAMLPAAPAAQAAVNPRLFAMAGTPSLSDVPTATARTREEKRFARADKNKDGKIETEELLAPRRKAFAKLDSNHDGVLQFNEWAVKTITKIAGADNDRSGWLSAAEYAETAPKPRRATRCSC